MGGMSYFNTVEHNMRLRRKELEALLQEDEIAVSLSTYPRLGNYCNLPVNLTLAILNYI